MVNQSDGTDNELKKSGKLKLYSIVVVVLIILSAILGTYYYRNNDSDDRFFVSGIGSEDTNVSFELSISHKPMLGKETTIHWKSFYEDTKNVMVATHPEVLEIILPEGIQLIEGNERTKIYPNDQIDFTWTIKPIETGDFYIRFGSCYWANETLMENDELKYYEVGEGHGLYYCTYLLGLQVENNWGEILEPEKAMVATYEFSNYVSTGEIDGYKSYTYEIGDIVWLNITVDAICDIPMVNTEIRNQAIDNLEPIDCSFKNIINLKEGTNTLRYKFRVLDHIEFDINNMRLSMRTQGTLAVFGKDLTYPVETCNLYFTLLTNNPSSSSTRSTEHSEIDQSLIINDNDTQISMELHWSSIEIDGITKADVQVSLTMNKVIKYGMISVITISLVFILWP